MDKLIDYINKLADKYRFDESEIKEIQKLIFNIEDPSAEEDADMSAEDFNQPVMEAEESELDEAYA